MNRHVSNDKFAIHFITEKIHDFKVDTLEGWKYIDAAENYGRHTYNNALDDIEKYINVGHKITKEILNHLRKP